MKSKPPLLILILLLILIRSSVFADSAWPIRLACDQAIRQGFPVDLNTGQSPVFIRGDDLEFQIGVLQNGNVVTNWTNVASITLEVYATQNDTNAPMIATNISTTNAVPIFNPNLTQANWTNGVDTMSTNQHADIFIPSASSSINLNGQASQSYWLRIFLSTTNTPVRTYTVLEGTITVIDGPIANETVPVPANFRVWDVNGNWTPQIYDPVSGHYYNLEIDTVAGIRTLSVGDIAY
jgi:hypothetical protein